MPDSGYIVDYGIGLSYRPARLQVGGPVQKPYARVDYITQSGIKNWATAGLDLEILISASKEYHKKGKYRTWPRVFFAVVLFGSSHPPSPRQLHETRWPGGGGEAGEDKNHTTAKRLL